MLGEDPEEFDPEELGAAIRRLHDEHENEDNDEADVARYAAFATRLDEEDVDEFVCPFVWKMREVFAV